MTSGFLRYTTENGKRLTRYRRVPATLLGQRSGILRAASTALSSSRTNSSAAR